VFVSVSEGVFEFVFEGGLRSACRGLRARRAIV